MIGYIIILISFCWVLAMLFIYALKNINNNELDQEELLDCHGEDFYSLDFKDEATCLIKKSLS